MWMENFESKKIAQELYIDYIIKIHMQRNV